ncbi:unnamed protein product [Echinostoma caproni]|uniref:Uncharacterized protein n=1 Tax=Echinostoma caproni TaxID=27848 RepID=A0A183B213_9TREM|nr:unnamed protein product [Echinostoma caproni]
MRVSVLRTWALLTLSNPCGVPTPLACHPRLRFRPPRPVLEFSENSTTDSVENQTDSIGYASVPYRCVLTHESPDWFEHPDGLSALIESVLCVLNQIAPPPNTPSTTTSPGCDEGEDRTGVPVPSFETVFRVLQTNPDSSAAPVSCLSSDLFLSLITDLNENLSRLLIEPSNPTDPAVMLQSPQSSVPPEQTRAAVISSMLAATMLDRMGDRIWPHDPNQLVQLFEVRIPDPFSNAHTHICTSQVVVAEGVVNN